MNDSDLDLFMTWEGYDKYGLNKNKCETMSSCSEIWKHFADSGDCIKNEQIANSGSLDLPCGKASFTATSSTPYLGPVHCAVTDPGTCKGQTIDPKIIDLLAGKFCDQLNTPGSVLTPTGATSYYKTNHTAGEYITTQAKVDYNFYVKWKPRCTLDGTERKLQNIQSCGDVFKSTFHDCDNKGQGGYKDQGCMRMGFEPIC